MNIDIQNLAMYQEDRRIEAKTAGMTQTKTLLYKLVEDGQIVPCGSNRNRTYKLKK